MAEEIVGIRIFAELENGNLSELHMTPEQRDLWFGVIAKFYQSKFTLSPIELNVPF